MARMKLSVLTRCALVSSLSLIGCNELPWPRSDAGVSTDRDAAVSAGDGAVEAEHDAAKLDGSTSGDDGGPSDAASSDGEVDTLDGAASCDGGEAWDSSSGQCAPLRCEKLPVPAHARIRYSSNERLMGVTATYVCETGYVPSSEEFVRSCGGAGSSAQWSGSAVTCVVSTPQGPSWTSYGPCDKDPIAQGCYGPFCIAGLCGSLCGQGFDPCPGLPAPLTPVCHDFSGIGRCIATGCTSASDCSPGLACAERDWIPGKACHACQSDDECPSSAPFCEPGTVVGASKCVSARFCDTVADCKPGEWCGDLRPDIKFCRNYCVSHADCPPEKPYCVNNYPEHGALSQCEVDMY